MGPIVCVSSAKEGKTQVRWAIAILGRENTRKVGYCYRAKRKRIISSWQPNLISVGAHVNIV